MTMHKTVVAASLFVAATIAAGQQCTDLPTVLDQNQLTSLGMVAGYLQDYPDAQPLISAVTATEPLTQEQMVTIFAPNNAAFTTFVQENPDAMAAIQEMSPAPVGAPMEAMPEMMSPPEPAPQPQRRLLQEPAAQDPAAQEQKEQLQQQLFQVLGAHIVPGVHTTESIVSEILSSESNSYSLDTLTGQTLNFQGTTSYTYNEEGTPGQPEGSQRGVVLLSVQDSIAPARALLLNTNTDSCTGPVHMINEVLIPGPEMAMAPEMAQLEEGTQGQTDQQPVRRLLRA